MGRALSIVERTRKTIFLIARFASIPESPSFSYGEYVKYYKGIFVAKQKDNQFD